MFRLIHSNQSGFTLLEAVMTIGLVSLSLMASFQLYRTTQTSIELTQDRLENTLDNIITEKILERDFFYCKHSLNNLVINDDSDKSFYSYLHDGYCSGSSCSRTFTFDIPEDPGAYSAKEFYVLTEDFKSTAGIVGQTLVQPERAYSSSGTTYTFQSLNYNNTLSALDNSPWTAEQLNLLYSPSYLRNSSDTPGVDPAKMLTYLGFVDGEDLNGTLKKVAPLPTIFSYKDPRTGNNITNEDNFLRNLPGIIGSPTYAFIAPVKLIRYRLRHNVFDAKSRVDLMRGELKSDGTFHERIIGMNVNEVVFSRETISSPAVVYQVSYKIKIREFR